jgi:FkbM family methyltransferase
MEDFRKQHFSMKNRLVSFVSQQVFSNFTYKVRSGLAAGLRRKGGLGFFPSVSSETREISFLRQLPIEDKVVYDIGAFEGIYTLYFARKAKKVVAYEPNPRNYARCLENVTLNDFRNVVVLNRGISERAGVIELVYDPLMPGAGSGERNIATQINSSGRTSTRVKIPVVSLDEDIRLNRLPKPDLIKIDIEGMELSALRGMRRLLHERHPALFIEMHGATTKEKSEIAHAVLALLTTCGYRSDDVEGERNVSPLTLGERCPSHLYATPF